MDAVKESKMIEGERETMTTYLLKVISLLGGLALFLFGMDVMGKSLERSAGGKLDRKSVV